MTLFEPLVTWKDWLDQLAHAAIGAFLVFGFSQNIPLLAACFLTLGIAVGREILYQHWLSCNHGCRTDIAGWLAGILGMAGFLLW